MIRQNLQKISIKSPPRYIVFCIEGIFIVLRSGYGSIWCNPPIFYMGLYGIEEMFEYLPELKESGSDIAGVVSKAASEETGLCEGTPVTAGMMDNMACFVGSGADTPGILNMIAGSWCVNQMTSKNIITGASANNLEFFRLFHRQVFIPMQRPDLWEWI